MNKSFAHKPRILLLLHLPPPIHGAAMMGKYMQESGKINNTYNCKFINLSLAHDINDIGRIRCLKFFRYLRLLILAIYTLIVWRPRLVYITPNSGGKAFVKDFILVQVLKAFGANVVLHFHNKGVAKYSNSSFYDWCYKHFFKNVKVILLAESLYNDIERYVNRKNVIFCANGIPKTDNSQSSLTLNKQNKSRLNILFLSNMLEDKGVWVLLQSCVELKKIIDFECHFVGGWGDIQENDFNERVGKYGLKDNVFAHGAAYGSQKEYFLSSADIFVFPSFNECFGLVLLEAMQYALPCISTREGGIPSIIDDGQTGILVDKRNFEALTDAIRKLNDNPELRIEMGKKGREKYEREYTFERFEERITQILGQCITV